jgi:hypothetical protein
MFVVRLCILLTAKPRNLCIQPYIIETGYYKYVMFENELSNKIPNKLFYAYIYVNDIFDTVHCVVNGVYDIVHA